jgi:hypothetical protein
MPIRINFLAEEQAAEDLRRQDPAKRAIFGGVALVVLTLAAAGFCQLKVSSAKAALAAQKDAYAKLEKKEKDVKDNLRKTGEIENNLTDLLKLATNRFAWGPVLNAFQAASVDHVQITSLRCKQDYVVVPPVPARKGTTEKPKPGMSTEIVVLVVEGIDAGPRANTSYIKFKDALANASYFKENLSKEKGWRFKGIPDEVVQPGGKTVVQFKLEGFYPEKVRSNE